eukprot:scaffold79925_cov50-Prasinocladus_malaysianus.AAC.1
MSNTGISLPYDRALQLKKHTKLKSSSNCRHVKECKNGHMTGWDLLFVLPGALRRTAAPRPPTCRVRSRPRARPGTSTVSLRLPPILAEAAMLRAIVAPGAYVVAIFVLVLALRSHVLLHAGLVHCAFLRGLLFGLSFVSVIAFAIILRMLAPMFTVWFWLRRGRLAGRVPVTLAGLVGALAAPVASRVLLPLCAPAAPGPAAFTWAWASRSPVAALAPVVSAPAAPATAVTAPAAARAPL